MGTVTCHSFLPKILTFIKRIVTSQPVSVKYFRVDLWTCFRSVIWRRRQSFWSCLPKTHPCTCTFSVFNVHCTICKCCANVVCVCFVCLFVYSIFILDISFNTKYWSPKRSRLKHYCILHYMYLKCTKVQDIFTRYMYIRVHNIHSHNIVHVLGLKV